MLPDLARKHVRLTGEVFAAAYRTEEQLLQQLLPFHFSKTTLSHQMTMAAECDKYVASPQISRWQFSTQTLVRDNDSGQDVSKLVSHKLTLIVWKLSEEKGFEYSGAVKPPALDVFYH